MQHADTCLKPCLPYSLAVNYHSYPPLPFKTPVRSLLLPSINLCWCDHSHLVKCCGHRCNAGGALVAKACDGRGLNETAISLKALIDEGLRRASRCGLIRLSVSVLLQ